jgi:hypothetical protein
MSRGKPGDPGAAPTPREPGGGRRLSAWRGLLLVVLAFALASALAGALGAANLGMALSFGQIAVALAVVYLMLRR